MCIYSVYTYIIEASIYMKKLKNVVHDTIKENRTIVSKYVLLNKKIMNDYNELVGNITKHLKLLKKNNIIEKWKTLIENSNYEVSNFGKIINIKTKKIKQHRTISTGFHDVTLWKNNKAKTFYVHRLVAIYFIPNTNKYKIVEHIDKNKTNNHISNLKWVKTSPCSNIKVYDKIKQIDSVTNKTIKIWKSFKEICNEFNVTWRDINNACINNKLLNGYKWKVYNGDVIEGEKWRVYRNNYEVSDYGRMRNKRTKRMLKLIKHANGYIVVGIKNKKSLNVHRAVAKSFISNPENKKRS